MAFKTKLLHYDEDIDLSENTSDNLSVGPITLNKRRRRKSTSATKTTSKITHRHRKH